MRISHDHVVDECGLVTLTYSLVKIDAYCPSGSDDIVFYKYHVIKGSINQYLNLGQEAYVIRTHTHTYIYIYIYIYINN